jgi:acetyl-CoA carboxylase biotin carboxyl carrier protein
MAEHKVKSEITGKVWKIVRPVGSRVAEDEEVIIVESMKMEIPVLAPADGEVVEIAVAEGDEVAEGQVVALIRG